MKTKGDFSLSMKNKQTSKLANKMYLISMHLLVKNS